MTRFKKNKNKKSQILHKYINIQFYVYQDLAVSLRLITEIFLIYSIYECMICFVAVGWLIFLGFETEFQSILGRLIGDMEAVHCVSYPFWLFLVRSSKGSYQTSRMCWTHHFRLSKPRMYCCVPVRRSRTEMIYQTVYTQSDCAHRSSMIRDCTV